MKKKYMFVMVLCLTLVFSSAVLFAASERTIPISPIKKCCVAGKYGGIHTDTNCCYGKPEARKFTMDIKQDRLCSAKISGAIIDPDGTKMNFTGSVVPTNKGCCRIEGKASKPGDTVTFSGFISTSAGKTAGKGVYISTSKSKGCTGNWEMSK